MLARVADARRGVVLPGEAAGELEAAQGLPERGVDNRRSAIGGGRLRYRPRDAQVVRAALARPDVVPLVLERDGRRVIPRARRRPAGHLVLARGGDAHLLRAAVNEAGRRLRRADLPGVDAEAVLELARVVALAGHDDGRRPRLGVVPVGHGVVGSLFEASRRYARLDWRPRIDLRLRVDLEHALIEGSSRSSFFNLRRVSGGDIVRNGSRDIGFIVERANPQTCGVRETRRRRRAQPPSALAVEREFVTEFEPAEVWTVEHPSHFGRARGVKR